MKWPLTAFLFVTAISLAAPYASNAKEPLDDADLRVLLRARVEASHDSEGIVVGIIDAHGPRIVSYGHAEGPKGRAVDGDTVYEIGSITKVFTSLILADMVGHGEVKLDDPAAKFLPSSVKAPSRNGREITLVDLATHTSGLPSLPNNFSPADPQNPYADYTVAQLYEFLSSYKLTNDIGANYEYSNLGGGLLGHVLALRAGTNYEALVEARICRPLGLTNTQITLTPELRERLAQGHGENGAPVSNWDLPTLAGAGALRSTVNDLLKFAAAGMGLTKTELQTAMELSETPRHAAGGMRIGLGWHIANKYGAELVWHNGGTGGYRSFIGLDKKQMRAVVVLVNSVNSVDELGFQLLEGPYKSQIAPANHMAIRLDPKIFAAYVGQYELQPGVTLTMKNDKGRYFTQMTGQPFIEIFPESDTNFFLKAVDAQLTFEKNEKGEATAVILHQGGMDQTAKKISSDIPKEKKHVAIALDPKIFDAYVGEYELQPGITLTMKREEGRFYTKLTGQSFLEIFPESETEFFLKVVDAQLTFEKNESGAVTLVILHQAGMDQKAMRMK